MPKKEPRLRFKDGPASAIGARSVVVNSATDHGSLAGLSDDDHGAIYPANVQAETITGDWTFTGDLDLSGSTVSLDCAAPDADSVNVAASSEGSNETYSRSDHTHNLDESITPTWTAGHTFQATMTTRDLLPEAQDTYDIGDSTYWYSQMFVSQINAAVFAEEQIALLGGWLYVSHDAGTFAAEVESADTKIDFGKAMTVSDFIVVKAYDISGTIKTEYIQVGALDAGTIYNVTRDLAAAHGVDPNWAAGTPFAVLGQTGDGRIELNAYDTPRIQIIVQDDAVTYNNTTEYLRLGDMNGAFGSDAADEWGFGVGDYAGGNFVAYNTTDGFELKAGDGAVRLDTSGIRLLETGAANSYISWTESDLDTGDTIAYMTTTWDGGAADPINFILLSYKAAGMSAGDAVAAFGASDVDAGTTGRITFISDGDARLVERLILNDTANANMTQGITIQQGSNDDEALAIKSYDDVAHGITDEAETDTFFTIKKNAPDAGGAALTGYRDADGTAGNALFLRGNLGEAADTTKSTAGIGIITTRSCVKSGTGITAPGADANLFAIRSDTNTRFIFDQEGEMHSDAVIGAGDDWDDWNDLALASDLSRLPKAKWDEMMRYGAEDFERAGLLTLSTDEDGTRHAFIKTKAMLQFSMCCFREVYDRMRRYERVLLDLGANPALLNP